MNPIVLIPARLAASRFPNKPLADIHGKPMIVHCVERALEANLGPVWVAAGDREIVDAVEQAGGKAVLTDPEHPSGSDRIWEAACKIDPDGRHDVIVNMQGDLPAMEPGILRAVTDPLTDPQVDIGTSVAIITDPEDRDNPNVVKAIAGFADGARQARALAFTRATAPWGDGPLYYHFGIYTYRRSALERFVALPPGVLEKREKLEQMRALENGMRIDAVLIDTIPLTVDTPEDLEPVLDVLG
jgi:3-deoxy-manno-octulosonate cytidylyltransferase (CMP-KDO synthetase)